MKSKLSPESSNQIPMDEFFNIPQVKAAQEIQKANPYGSHKHRMAFEVIEGLAMQYGVDMGEY